MFAPATRRHLQRRAQAVATLGAATAGFFMGYLLGKGADRSSKPEQPAESRGWFGSPFGGGHEMWTRSPDGKSISVHIEGANLPATPLFPDPEPEGWRPTRQPSAMPVMPRREGVLFTPPETWELVPEEEMVPGRTYGTTPPMPKPGLGRILVYPHTDGEEHMLSGHWEGEGEDVGDRGPMRGTSVEGYAPAVLMWAYHMPSREKFLIVDEGATWLPLDEVLYNQKLKDL